MECGICKSTTTASTTSEAPGHTTIQVSQGTGATKPPGTTTTKHGPTLRPPIRKTTTTGDEETTTERQTTTGYPH